MDYARFVAAFLHRLGVHGAELEDIVQDVFMAAHHKGGYRPGAASPTTFLARLALDARRTTRRRNRRFWKAHSASLASALFDAHSPTPEHDLALQQAAQRCQASLDTLDPETRAIFLLFELEGESCEAIAAAFGLKLGTVYSRLHAARAEFHSQVARAERRENSLPRSTQGKNHGPRTHALTRK